MTHIEKTRRRPKPSVSGKSLREHEPQLRQSILEIARELFVNEGYEQVSMRRIGAEAGCSPMAMYRYFASKEELLASICEETFERLEGQLATIDDNISPLERLRSALKAVVAFAVSNPNPYRLIFLTLLPSGPLAKRRIRMQKKLTVLYSALVTECIREKGLPMDLELKVNLLRAGIHGMAIGAILNMFAKKDIPSLAETMINTLTREFE